MTRNLAGARGRVKPSELPPDEALAYCLAAEQEVRAMSEKFPELRAEFAIIGDGWAKVAVGIRRKHPMAGFKRLSGD